MEMSNSLTINSKNIFYVLLISAVLFVAAFMLNSKQASAAACAAPSADYGTVTSTVNIPQAGTYRIWSRMVTPNATDNSYMLEVDGNTCFIVGDGSFNASTWNTNSSNWVDYQSGTVSNKINMNLTAGNHTIKMIGNAPDVMLDRVIFTSDSSCIPSGTGEDCANPPDTTPPTVSITGPANNSNHNGGTVTVSATATDDVGGSGMQKVEFYVDNVLQSTDNSSPYQHSLNTSNLSVGSHTLMARAYDMVGNFASSSVVTINVAAPPDTTKPTAVTVTAPANGSTQSGTITVSATATDNVAVTKMEFYVDGTIRGTDTSSPFSMSLDTKALSNGNRSITAKAFDAANNSADSTAVTINVNNPVVPPPDTTPPTVSISNPANNSTQSGTITVSANATDNVGISKVEFYVDGALASTDSSAPFDHSLNTTALTQGAHVLRVRAYDTAPTPNATWSSNVNITVNNVTYIDEDINQDGKVNSQDFGRLILVYGQTGANLGRADINKDGRVNSQDFGRLVQRYGFGT